MVHPNFLAWYPKRYFSSISEKLYYNTHINWSLSVSHNRRSRDSGVSLKNILRADMANKLKITNIFKGRIRRSDFALVFFSLLIIGFAKIFIFNAIINQTLSLFIGILSGIILLIAIIRRLRDINLSGWWAGVYLVLQFMLAVSTDGLRTVTSGQEFFLSENLLILTITISTLCILCIIIFLIFRKSTPSANSFGPSVLPNTSFTKAIFNQ